MRNKKLLAVVLAAALTCSGLPIQGIGTVNVFAEEEAASDFTIDENGVLTKYNGNGGDVIIPEGVTEIGRKAFSSCTSLTSVTIPEGVTVIGKFAFFNCSNLTSITIPKSVTVIGDNAFQHCISLTSITIPEGVTEIGSVVFSYCTSLSSIKVAAENSKYDSRENCNAIIETETNTLISGCKNTIIPESVTAIGGSAFGGCTSLTSVIIPDGVTAIGGSAFGGCSSLTSVTIPESVTSIGGHAFYDTKWLKDKQTENPLVIVNHIVIDGSACNGDVEIPEGVTSIGNEAFGSCWLTSITIPESVKIIGDSAFWNCSSLTSITIPESVTSIGRNAFRDTKWLEERQTENPIVIVNHIIIDGSACDGDVEIPEGVTAIGNSAFSGCSNLTNIIIPEGVINIGNYAFEDCDELRYIEIPESVTIIGNNAFDGCSSLTTIRGKKGSYAQQYVNESRYKFEDVDETSIQLSPGVNKLPAYCIEYIRYECRQIPNEKQEGIYFLNNRTLSFYSFSTGKINTIYEWNDVTDSYVANGKLYVLEAKENTMIYIYNLDSMDLEKTIPIEFSAYAIGADEQQRIYLAGGYGENTKVYLLSADGDLLSSASAVDSIYDFIGIDSVTGNFYFECYYPYTYWGYKYDMHGVGTGNVSGNNISVTKDLLQTMSREPFCNSQRAADLIGGRYLCVDAPMYVTYNPFTPFLAGLFVWDSNQSNATESSYVGMMSLSRSYVDAEDYQSSIGSRCVYNEKNDSIISYIDNETLGEFIPGNEDCVGTYKTEHPVFSLEKYNDYIFAFEKENDEYYLEIIEWKHPSTLKISADTSEIQVGEDMQLSVTSDGTVTDNYIWESSDSKIASVTSDGKVFAWREGTAEITVKTSGGISASYTVHVTKSGAEKNFTKELGLSGTVSNNISKNSYYTYGSVVNSHLMENSDGTLTRLENVNGSIVIEVYNKDTGAMLSNKTVDFELSSFGGFYNGADANYLVFGQSNEQEDDSTEVMRIVKYSKDWNRLASVSVYGANTYIPFDAGSLKMTETNGRLYIHTCHEMYAGDDELHHQANMTFVINESDMVVEDSNYEVGNLAQNGYVSHSFNQFIQADGDYIYRVDHGDGYPRAITLTRCKDGESIEDVAYTQPFIIGGAIGNNWTGVSVGGFQISSDNCLIAGNSVSQENFNGTDGLRNIFLTITNKSSFKTDIVWLTDYTDNTVEVGTPQIVKLGDDQFLLMWEECVTSSKSFSTKVVTIDGRGNKTSDITTILMHLSDCQPIVTSDGLVRWYQSDGSKVTLYTINPFTLDQFSSFMLGDVDFDGKINLNDAKLLLKGAVGIITLTEEQQKAGDINNDQKINLNDAKMLLRAAVGIIKL